MNKPLSRYKLEHEHNGGTMRSDEQGEWVRWEEYQELEKRLEQVTKGSFDASAVMAKENAGLRQRLTELERDKVRLEYVMQHPMHFHHKIFMELCGGLETEENERFRQAIDSAISATPTQSKEKNE